MIIKADQSNKVVCRVDVFHVCDQLQWCAWRKSFPGLRICRCVQCPSEPQGNSKWGYNMCRTPPTCLENNFFTIQPEIVSETELQPRDEGRISDTLLWTLHTCKEKHVPAHVLGLHMCRRLTAHSIRDVAQVSLVKRKP